MSSSLFCIVGPVVRERKNGGKTSRQGLTRSVRRWLLRSWAHLIVFGCQVARNPVSQARYKPWRRKGAHITWDSFRIWHENTYLSWPPDLHPTFLEHHLRKGTQVMVFSFSRKDWTYLAPVGQPAYDSWYSKKNWEEIKREPCAWASVRSPPVVSPTHPSLCRSGR